MILGYCSISAFEPVARLDAQKRDLAVVGAQEFFCEKTRLFGRTPELERAIEYARNGDVIVVTKPYRIARSTRGMGALIARLARKGVGLRIPNTPIDTSTTTGRMVLGSAPLWSLGASPMRALLWDAAFAWRR
jgi:DNA invertase Pin-like site-specific DNA recombinase